MERTLPNIQGNLRCAWVPCKLDRVSAATTIGKLKYFSAKGDLDLSLQPVLGEALDHRDGPRLRQSDIQVGL